MKKQDLTSFYDNEGWKFQDDFSADSIINENLTEVASDYVTNVRNRIQEHLGSGESLLDIGCGPIQYPEYLEYSNSFSKRVCVDLSNEALKIARNKLGGEGRFILGDYLELPSLKDAPFSAAALINVLYHCDKMRQEEFVRKILNDLTPGAKLVIIYSNPYTFSALLTKFLVGVKRSLMIRRGKDRKGLENPIYFYRHSIRFWKRFTMEAEVSKFAWRTFSPQLEKLLFHQKFGGRLMLKILFNLEKIPSWAYFSEYTLVVLKKI